MNHPTYSLLQTTFGLFTLGWERTSAGLRVDRILLPRERPAEELTSLEKWSTPLEKVPEIAGLAERMARFLCGEAVVLPLNLLLLERCSGFQRRVLLAEHGIPRGQVSTCGRIARQLGVPGAARGVGQALARELNPEVTYQVGDMRSVWLGQAFDADTPTLVGLKPLTALAPEV